MSLSQLYPNSQIKLWKKNVFYFKSHLIFIMLCDDTSTGSVLGIIFDDGDLSLKEKKKTLPWSLKLDCSQQFSELWTKIKIIKILCFSFFLFAVTKINDESLLIVCCRLNINFIVMISSSELICLCPSAYPRSGWQSVALFSVTLFVSGHNMLIESRSYLPLWLSLLAAIICSFRFFKRFCQWTTEAAASLWPLITDKCHLQVGLFACKTPVWQSKKTLTVIRVLFLDPDSQTRWDVISPACSVSSQLEESGGPTTAGYSKLPPDVRAPSLVSMAKFRHPTEETLHL